MAKVIHPFREKASNYSRSILSCLAPLRLFWWTSKTGETGRKRPLIEIMLHPKYRCLKRGHGVSYIVGNAIHELIMLRKSSENRDSDACCLWIERGKGTLLNPNEERNLQVDSAGP